MASGGLPAEELQRLSTWPAEVARSDLAAHFTFSLEDLRWVRSQRGAVERIGLAVQLAALRFLGFTPGELVDTPPEVARHVGNQIGVAPATFTRYAREVDGRTRRRHVAAVVEHAGWRACAQPERNALAGWLTERALEHDTPTVLFGQALDQLRAERVVRPGLDRLMRAVSSSRVAGRKEIRRRLNPDLTPERCDELDSEIARLALYRAEQALLGLIAARVDRAVVEPLEELIAVSDDEDNGEDVLALIKSAPGNVSLDTMLVEISKLEAIRAIGLPVDLFADIAPTVIAGWRARAMVESPSHLREHPQATKLALLCALLVLREREVTDTLAQLLISTIHRINAHAEKKVVEEVVKDFRRVRGKDTMLRKIAEASLRTPDDSVREVIYPVVGGVVVLSSETGAPAAQSRDLLGLFAIDGSVVARNALDRVARDAGPPPAHIRRDLTSYRLHRNALEIMDMIATMPIDPDER